MPNAQMCLCNGEDDITAMYEELGKYVEEDGVEPERFLLTPDRFLLLCAMAKQLEQFDVHTIVYEISTTHCLVSRLVYSRDAVDLPALLAEDSDFEDSKGEITLAYYKEKFIIDKHELDKLLNRGTTDEHVEDDQGTPVSPGVP